jgi:hypothetical protein
MTSENQPIYNDGSWLDMAERVFGFFLMPTEGHTAIYAARRFFESAPEEFYQRHPREWTALARTAIERGATPESVAKSADVGIAELRRRLAEQT